MIGVLADYRINNDPIIGQTFVDHAHRQGSIDLSLFPLPKTVARKSASFPGTKGRCSRTTTRTRTIFKLRISGLKGKGFPIEECPFPVWEANVSKVSLSPADPCPPSPQLARRFG